MLGDRAPRIITTLHGTDITLVGADSGYLPITRFSVQQSDGVTVPSEFLRDEAARRLELERPELVEVVPNFVDTSRYAPAERRDPDAIRQLFLSGGADDPLPDDALTLIARQSAGGMRDAISLLDQLASTGEKIDLGLTQTVLGTATSQIVLQLVDSIAEDHSAQAMDSIHQALDSGADPRSLARQIVEYLRGLMIIQMHTTFMTRWSLSYT